MRRFYKVHPIPICRLTIDEGAFLFLNMGDYGEKVSIPVYIWLIEGGEEPLLVDTGCSAQDFLKYTLFAEDIRDVTPIEEALPRLGIPLSEVKTIIITHLDADHILNARKFPKARFLVQEKEIRFARNPVGLGGQFPNFYLRRRD